MKGSAKSDDRFTRGVVFILYVTLFLISVTYVSMIQINLNTSTTYNLNIEFEEHIMTGTGYGFDHSYNTIIVNIPVMVRDYESTLSGIRVGNFPFWVDTSDWVDSETVSISGNLYSIVSEMGNWRLHRSFDDFEYEDLCYHKVLGILIESTTDRMSLGESGFSGTDAEIVIQQSNIDGFVARVTNSNVLGHIVLLTLIFSELMIIQAFWERRRRLSSGKQASS